MTNVHAVNNTHGMNRQQQRHNPHHFNQHQQSNSHHRAPGNHPQRPVGSNPNQQRHSTVIFHLIFIIKGLKKGTYGYTRLLNQ